MEVNIRNVVKLLDNYTEISGLRVNYKSELALLGKSIIKSKPFISMESGDNNNVLNSKSVS